MSTGIYEYKGKHYIYEGTCKIKDPTTRKWIDGIKYLRNGQEYVREAKEFVQKFKPVSRKEETEDSESHNQRAADNGSGAQRSDSSPRHAQTKAQTIIR
jgi:hypothetical protein